MAMLLAIAALLLAGGCKAYDAHFARSYEFGHYQLAEQQLRSEAGSALTNSNHRDHLIYLLEHGAIQRTVGNLSASNEVLDQADDYFRKLDDQAAIRVGAAAKAAVTNLAELAYQGYGYDRIMVNVYKALNYLEQGNLDFARAELRRVAYAQQQIEQRKARRLEQLEEEAASSANYNPRAMSDPGLASQTQQLYAGIPDNSLKAAYLNAFAEYLQAIFMLHAGDADDREVGRTAIRRTLSMVDNPYVRQDLEWVERLDREPITYVILESGVAPMREEVRIDIPVWFFNLAFADTGGDYVGVAFPRLVPQASGIGYVQAQCSTGAYPTRLLVDMDGVIAREFKDELPSVITRTLIAAGTKASIAFAAHRITRDDPLLNLITRIATTAYQYSLNNADLRTWRTLPKTINIARFPTPPDGNVNILAPSGAVLAHMQLDPTASNVIWIRSPGSAATVVCRAFLLDNRISPTADQALSHGSGWQQEKMP